MKLSETFFELLPVLSFQLFCFQFYQNFHLSCYRLEFPFQKFFFFLIKKKKQTSASIFLYLALVALYYLVFVYNYGVYLNFLSFH